MRRSGATTHDLSQAKAPAHPLLLQADLQVWAGEHIAEAGRHDALVGRVENLWLSAGGRSIEARVRGNRPLPYQLAAWVEGRSLASRCNCSHEAPAPCRHAVAALEVLRFPLPLRPRGTRTRRHAGRPGRGRGRIIQHAPASQGFVILGLTERIPTRDERIALAREEEITARRQRARRERATVRLVPVEDGAPRYEVTRRRGAAPETVTLRGAGLAWASCTCADFGDNELGTCTHVERVRAWRGRRRKGAEVAGAQRLSIWCCPREWTEQLPDPLREVRVDDPQGDEVAALGRYFEPAGWLRPCPVGRQPSAWARSAVAAAERHGRRRGVLCEVVPAVIARIEAAARTERQAARTGAIDGAGGAWRKTIDRLGFRLHPYQVEGALFLARNARAFLADDMGLGKTIEAIAAALLLRQSRVAHKALVVCPASLKYQWSREIKQACGERAAVLDGPRAGRLAAYAAWRKGFLIVNYELVLRDLQAIRAAGADLVILDEAQRIKNWETATARAVKQLDSPRAFILTGTPLENRLLELHSLVEFLHPRALGPRWRLVPFHAAADGRGRVIAYEGLDVLRRRLEGFFLRRERREVLDQLPERTDNTFWTGMTTAQRRLSRRHAAAAAALLGHRGAIGPAQVRALLRALTSMRILCNAHAQYAWERHAARLAQAAPPTRRELRALGSPKLEEFARVLEDLLDQSEAKIVVFSQWERMLRLAQFAVREPLERRDLRSDLFHGALNSRARGAVLEAFRLDPALRVLFSTDAGGLGLNLQESASIVVNLEVPWNPAVLEQRIGRVHRIGQRRSVQVLHFVTRDAIEERVLQVLEGKRALFRGLLSEQADQVILDAPGRSSFVERVRGLFEEGVKS